MTIEVIQDAVLDIATYKWPNEIWESNGLTAESITSKFNPMSDKAVLLDLIIEFQIDVFKTPDCLHWQGWTKGQNSFVSVGLSESDYITVAILAIHRRIKTIGESK